MNTRDGATISNLLYRWGRFAARNPWRVIGCWVLVALAAVFLNASFGGKVTNEVQVPGTESQSAADLVNSRFPSRGESSGLVVFADHNGDLTDPGDRTAIVAALAALQSDSGVASVSDPFDPTERTISADGLTAFATVRYHTQPGPVEAGAAFDALKIARAAGLDAELSKSISGAQSPEGNEGIGLFVAMIVLLVAFGSVIAAGIPIGTAVFGIFIGLSLIGLMAGATDVPAVSTLLATMIGLGVGIDYSLFVVTRHRGFLHDGHSPVDAAGLANATSGSAVLFAGTTVVIALAGLRLAGIPGIAVMGLASAAVVVVAMLAAVSLLPALLGLAGDRIDRFHVGRRRPAASSSGSATWTWSAQWAHVVSQRPWRFLLASLTVLLALAVPVMSMHTGVADDGNADPSLTYRKAYDMLSEGFGRGFGGPLTIVVDGGHISAAAAAVRDAISETPGVAQAIPAIVNAAGDTAIITVFPTTSPQDEATAQLVHRLRSTVLPASLHGSGAHGYVTGQTAASIDISDRLSSRLPLFIAAVIGLSFLLLMVVFRSLLVPLKAAIMNLLSIGAAYGAVVAVFQWGWGKGLVGLHESVPISPFLPMIMFAVLFGLSMDYEVFLLSRIREEYFKTGDSRRSVVDGLGGTARVITSAALIMISVFASFLLVPDIEIKMFAVGLTVAVFVDATIVRMILVPATMELMGDANWWLPRWLDRILPNIDIEGTALAASHPTAQSPDNTSGRTGTDDDRELELVG
jgi:putative drug exporter of the RND superfamily